MVLMRRKDKRRGNAEDEVAAASDASIVANKGVRSLGGARSGRFAADMRASVGGYGRADKTWGVDHPWHVTEEDDLFSALCAKDRMEEGALVKEQLEQHEEPALGLSRAQLKKRKAKLKKLGLSAHDAAVKALHDAELAKQRHEEEAQAEAQKVMERRAAKKKQKKQQQQHEDEEADEEKEAAKAEALREAKREKRQKEKEKKKEKKQAALAAAEQTSEAQQADLAARETLAAAYEEVVGSEVTTKSGLVVQDQRIGQGKLPLSGEMLTVKYRGRLGREGLVFGKGMLTTRFGTGSVIAGWEEGLGSMRPGGVRLLTIPPELGYGESGKGDKIPPNSTLFFEVELVRIGKRKRDAVGEGDVPLPSSFQRKRIKQKSSSTNRNDDDENGGELSKNQLKKRRRNRNKSKSKEDA